MKSKWVYVGAVLLSLLAVLGIAKFIEPENVRVQQHLSYNTEVEDTNLSIEPSSFSSHLPVVSIETEGQTIPGRPETGQKVSQVKNTFIRAEMKIIENQGAEHTERHSPDRVRPYRYVSGEIPPDGLIRPDICSSSLMRTAWIRDMRSWEWKKTAPGCCMALFLIRHLCGIICGTISQDRSWSGHRSTLL